MMYEMINKMVDEINFEIKFVHQEYANNGQSEFYWKGYNRIQGMIRMLEIVTGKRYYFDQNGLHEK